MPLINLTHSLYWERCGCLIQGNSQCACVEDCIWVGTLRRWALCVAAACMKVVLNGDQGTAKRKLSRRVQLFVVVLLLKGRRFFHMVTRLGVGFLSDG